MQLLLCGQAGDSGVWARAPNGVYTNKATGKCIGFGKKGANHRTVEGKLANRLVALDVPDGDDDKCARSSPPPMSPKALKIPDCDTEIPGQKMPCFPERFKWESDWWLVAYGGQKMLKVDVEAASLLQEKSVLLHESKGPNKVCPTRAMVHNTPREKRWLCWDASKVTWWKRCGFNYWTGECGGSTGVPCHVFPLSGASHIPQVADDCLEFNQTVTENKDKEQ